MQFKHFGIHSFFAPGSPRAQPLIPSNTNGWDCLSMGTSRHHFFWWYVHQRTSHSPQLKENFHWIDKMLFFQYLQNHSFVQCNTPNFPTEPENPLTLSTWKDVYSAQKTHFLKPVSSEKGIISCMYAKILLCVQSLFISHEEPLGMGSWTGTWQGPCQGENLVLSTCQQVPASFIHMFLSCPFLHNVWTEIFSILSTILNVAADPIPWSSLFGVLPSTQLMPKYMTLMTS